jgi:UDP-glucose 4-epimerase
VNGLQRALVTGGAGFIGSHLVERLLDDGHEVIVLDNFSTGREENLEHVNNSRRLTVHRADISNHEEIESLFEEIDWVFHLAALAAVVPSIQRPLEYFRANVDGTIAVLEAARTAGVSRFAYAASSSCYGIPDQFPTPETAPIRTMYPYALTKYLGEQCVLHWNKVYKLPCVSLRLFNVYGPRARTSGAYGAVFGTFLAQKLAGKPFTVVGDGTQTRDFTFVTDVVDAFVRAAESEVEGTVFNVGTGNPYSINYLAGLLGGDVIDIPKRPGEPDCTCADISQISQLLGWQPKVSFEEGVQIMLRNIDQWRQAPVWDDKSIMEATRDWFAYLGDSPS